MLSLLDEFFPTRDRVSRRRVLRALPAATVAAGGWSIRDAVAVNADDLRRRDKAMILLWMAGGPPQIETFDPKPALSEFGAIATATPGIEIGELWPEVAKASDEWCFVRSLSNKEGEHQRATYQVHTGYVPVGSLKHPSIGASISERLVAADKASRSELPPVAAVARIGQAIGAGYLGVDYEPFVVPTPGEMPRNLDANVEAARLRRRLKLTSVLDEGFAARGREQFARQHQSLYKQAGELVLSPETDAFSLDREPQGLKEAYGDTDFGRGCLLARRLVERGVRFVEVVSQGWDLHDDLAGRMRSKSAEVDPAMTTLVRDLKSRGMLDDTLVVWMGEFGRTPKINGRSGRDHFPVVFNAAMAGGGIRGGQVVGASSPGGNMVADRPVSVRDLHATFCRALGIDPEYEHMSPVGRPMKIVDGGTAIDEAFTG